MGWFTGILELLKALFKAIPVISKWFTKSPTQKSNDAASDAREENDHFKKTGRPKW